MKAVDITMVKWMEQSHLFKRQLEVDKKLDTGLHDQTLRMVTVSK